MYKINKKDVHWFPNLTKSCIMKISITAIICSVFFCAHKRQDGRADGDAQAHKNDAQGSL